MRSYVKNNIIDLIKSMFEVHDIVKNIIDEDNSTLLEELFSLCKEAGESIKTQIEVSQEKYIIQELEEYISLINHFTEDNHLVVEINDLIIKLNDKLLEIETIIINKVKIHYEIVFLPYKASMWDSLESIWLAANEDENCKAKVIPIPYFERNSDRTFGKMIYEGNQFPEYVPIIDYKEYSLEENHPDIIYIHNPYDNLNYVTSIHPHYYSDRIKQFTSSLVYVPYYISGYYSDKKQAKISVPCCIDNVDFIVLQSERQKEALKRISSDEEKMIVMGSPKIDYVVNHMGNIQIPLELEKKINKRKCVLYNVPLTEFLESQDWVEKMNNLINYFKEKEDLFFIWRPHPLLSSTMKSMRPFIKKEFDHIIETLGSMENVEIDERSTADISIEASDALISDYSSIICQYTVTGKPVLVTTGTRNDRYFKIVNFDYFDNYFLSDGMTIEKFISTVVLREDKKREERKKSFESSIENSDGTCGRKIHQYMIQQLKKFNFKF